MQTDLWAVRILQFTLESITLVVSQCKEETGLETRMTKAGATNFIRILPPGVPWRTDSRHFVKVTKGHLSFHHNDEGILTNLSQ